MTTQTSPRKYKVVTRSRALRPGEESPVVEAPQGPVHRPLDNLDDDRRHRPNDKWCQRAADYLVSITDASYRPLVERGIEADDTFDAVVAYDHLIDIFVNTQTLFTTYYRQLPDEYREELEILYKETAHRAADEAYEARRAIALAAAEQARQPKQLDLFGDDK